MLGTDGDDVIVGRGGRDHIYGRGGNDRICLGAGPPPEEMLDLQVGSGGPGKDLIKGGRHPEYLGGRTGSDSIWGGGGGDHIGGNAGNDKIWGGGGHDRLNGYAGSDRLWGQGGPDGLEASPGDDILIGGRDGWGGGDHISFHGADVGLVRADLAAGFSVADGLGRDVLRGIEGLFGTDKADRFRGDHRDNIFYASDGDDHLEGMGGDDCFMPFFGMNVIDGGEGFDTYSADTRYGCVVDPSNGLVTDRGNGKTIDLKTGEATSERETTPFTSIEAVVGGSGGDMIFGDGGPNFIHGGGGPDQIDGRGGDDELDGGRGEDDVDGGDGHDVCLNAEVFINCEEGPLHLLFP